MRVLFFAQIREFTKRDATELRARSALDADEIWKHLDEQFPGIGKFRRTTRLARNSTFADADEQFGPHDEVALLPPVSGG